MHRRKYVFMAQATDGSQGGAAGDASGAGAAGAAGAAGSGQGSADGSASGAGASSGSALATGQAAAGSGQGAASGAAAGPNDWIPEKYRVAKADGQIDIEASARKVADAHRHLEQRLGSGDIPPKTPEEYDIKGLPETVKIEDIKADPEMQSFLKSAHGKGLTNDQVSFVLNEYLARAPKLVENGQKLTAEDTTKALREVWKDESGYQQNMGHAFKAASAIADKAGVTFADLEKSGLGDHPLFIRLMASIGPEMSDDTIPSGANAMISSDWDDQVAELRANPAYTDQKHPQHKQIMDKMQALYTRRYGTKKQTLFSGVGN
jgi:hypothetical protein